MDLALNNLQRLICHKNQQIKPNLYTYIYIYICVWVCVWKITDFLTKNVLIFV